MAATTVCFYSGTPDTFAADAASSSSNKGSFTPATSTEANLNAAMVAGYIVKAVSRATVTIVLGASVTTIPGFVWTLSNQ
jgi:hypothetical protein